MRRFINGNGILVASGVLLFTFLWVIPATAEPLSKITDSVYTYHGVKNAGPQNSYGSNAGIIVGERGVVVVDTLSSAKEARRLIADIRSITDKPIRYVVNTHFHFDHTLGNCEFVKLGAAIVSQEKGRENTIKYGDKIFDMVKTMGMTDELLQGTTIATPTLTFQNRMNIDLGDVTVELHYIGPSHSPDNLLVFVPREKLLFTGDILFSDFHAYLGGSDLEGWGKNLDYIMTLDAEKIVPGHGPFSTKKNITDMKEYLIAFDRHAKELCAASKEINEIVAEMKKRLPAKAQGDWMIRANLMSGYFKGEK